MNIDRYDVLADEGYAGEFWTVEVFKEDGEYIRYDDHIKVVDSYLAEITAAKVEIDKLMLSLEAWDEEFK